MRQPLRLLYILAWFGTGVWCFPALVWKGWMESDALQRFISPFIRHDGPWSLTLCWKAYVMLICVPEAISHYSKQLSGQVGLVLILATSGWLRYWRWSQEEFSTASFIDSVQRIAMSECRGRLLGADFFSIWVLILFLDSCFESLISSDRDFSDGYESAI